MNLVKATMVILSEIDPIYANRMAAHLRMVAQLLRERGGDAPPLDAQRSLAAVFSKQLPESFWQALFENLAARDNRIEDCQRGSLSTSYVMLCTALSAQD
ncbi:MAG: hypothetical protein MZV70_58940 [Desulfobacterales bacterium]|nr:hypothetical protein [Desulfobacterales bacterium]